MTEADPDAVPEAVRRAHDFLLRRDAQREALYVGVLAGAGDPTAIGLLAGTTQKSDGAIGPLLAGDAPGPGVASTADALGWLIPLGLAESPVAATAAGYLVRSQGEDGGWSDLSAPGEEPTLALSATVCGVLARCPAARQSTLRRAAAHLAARWSCERAQRGSYPLLAGYLHAFVSVPADLDEADTALQWCGRELERGFRTAAFGAAAVGDVFVRCDATAVPGARLDGAEIRAALLREQRLDGGFGSPAAEIRDTCKAALALWHLAGAWRAAPTR